MPTGITPAVCGTHWPLLLSRTELEVPRIFIHSYLQDRLNLPFFDPVNYNSFEETGQVELMGEIHGLKKDGRNEFTLPERLPQGWSQFPKEKLIKLFMACPPEVQKRLQGHPKMWEDPENYTGLDSDPQVLAIASLVSCCWMRTTHH